MANRSDASLDPAALSRRETAESGGSKPAGVVFLWHIAPLLLSLALLVPLFTLSDFGWSQVSRTLGAVSLPAVLGAILLTAAFLSLSALKWRIVMKAMSEEHDVVAGWMPAFFYTSLGATLSLVLLPQIAVPTGRALGARLHLGQPPARVAGASVFEQLFDVAVMLAAAAVAFCVLFPQFTPVVLLSFVLCAAGVLAFPRTLSRIPFVARKLSDPRLAALRTGAVLSRLLWISFLRYLLLGARAVLVMYVVGLGLGLGDFVASFSLVQLSRLVSVTPMGLGIADWSWAGMLGLFGLPLSVAAGFVLVNRALNIAAVVACLAVSGLAMAVSRGAAR